MLQRTFLLLLTGLLALPAAATTVTVEPGRLATALAQAGPGDTLHLLPGVHPGPVRVDAAVTPCSRRVGRNCHAPPVGFLPENVALHPGMTGRECLDFYARLKGVSLAGNDARCPASDCQTMLRGSDWPLIPRACASVWGWPRLCWAIRACGFWTNRPPAWTRRCGRASMPWCARCLDGVRGHTNGAFDITVLPLWELHAQHFAKTGADPQGPPARAIDALRPLVDYRTVVVEPSRIAFTRPGMAGTLNGIAQGYITDRIADLLLNEGMRDHAFCPLRGCRVGHALKKETPPAVGTAGSVEGED